MKAVRAIELDEPKEPAVKTMGDMEPLEICVIVDDFGGYKGFLVMRTASKHKFEVIDLTNLKERKYWDNKDCTLKVKPYKGGSIVLEFE